MNIHEYQAKQIFRDYGVAVPEGRAAFTVEEAVEAAKELGGDIHVVKAQIHAGGRGKGGGVKLAKSIDEVRTHAEAILGMQLVTHQTGPEGQKVRRLYIEQARTSRPSSTSGSSSTAARAASSSWRRPRAAWTSRRSPSTPPSSSTRSW